jgi:aldehyde dehydrogenase (NAD+)
MDTCARISSQRRFFQTGATKSVAFRRDRLRALLDAVERRESDLLDALHEDLGKPRIEAWASEIGHVAGEIRHALRHLGSWMRPQRHRASMIAWPSVAWEFPEPFGVALIIGPWNYPAQLVLVPTVAAIAAGNCALLKPSEYAPCTSAVLGRLVEDTFDPDHLTVIQGGQETAAAALRAKPDIVFFTGSTAVGRDVMQAAAAHLTPVILELGGRSPCIVCADAPMDVTARRIAWGKCLNAGQTCVAPNHVFVERRVMSAFVEKFKQALHGFYGDDALRSPDFGRIVNRRHFDRICALIDNSDVAFGGRRDPDALRIEPTVVIDPPRASPLMCEEIFGPVLPVIGFDTLDEVLERLQAEEPLALYLFTRDRGTERRVLAATRSGGVCINDTISHLLARDLPFGGIGASGMGRYHGKAGFDAFSHRRAIMRRRFFPDPAVRYPPIRTSLETLRRMMRWFGS